MHNKCIHVVVVFYIHTYDMGYCGIEYKREEDFGALKVGQFIASLIVLYPAQEERWSVSGIPTGV